MVDVLINSLLKSRDTATEELSSSTDRTFNIPEGEEGWRGMCCEHPLSAATSAMLNIGGRSSSAPSSNEDSLVLPLASSAVSLLCEYYKIPLDKAIVDKYASLPEFWTALATNSQASNVIGNSSNVIEGAIPVSLLPQAAELLRNRRISNPGDVTSREMDSYLNRRIVKREVSESGKILVPTSSPVISIHKSSDILNNSIAIDSGIVTLSSESPLPLTVQVKQEQDSSFVPSSLSPPITKMIELPSASSALVHAYSNQILAQRCKTLYSQYTSSQYEIQPAASLYMVATPPEYRGMPDYYTEQILQNLVATIVPGYTDVSETGSFMDGYIRQATARKAGAAVFEVDLPSPDCGIGDITGTPRETTAVVQSGEIFEYSEVSEGPAVTDIALSRPASTLSGSSRRSCHDFGRHAESDKIHIPKIHSDVGFQYFLESPISTSVRREDDRITYINKGQFYGITFEYITDAIKPLKSTTVKSVVILMFRDDKAPEEEMKAWQFWHSRQHSVKQRIIDADTKNSIGIIGQIEEVTHNAVVFYWNPLEAPAKINVAVHCLSTDFSNQKGVKGLPLHLQIDTYDDFRENATPHHRGYFQIKVFCDKGAERKTRDEERRAAKRKLNSASAAEATALFPGRKKLEEMYHLPCDRSQFYSMSDLLKPPILFTPSGDLEQMTSIDLSLYTTQGSLSETTGNIDPRNNDSRSSSTYTPPPKKIKFYPTERVLLYARQESEESFQPLHVYPPTLEGLAKGIENKYNISASNVRNIYKRSKKGITIQVDDAVVKRYFNEDACIIEVNKVNEVLSDITLVDL